jgi:nanoRNase/pAp phosphatase (c-di-AMP/oligoRNAs hydrolase)
MDLQKATELLRTNSHIAIVIPENADFDTLASAEVLSAALSARGIYVGFPPRKNPLALPVDFFPYLSSPSPLLYEFIISVHTDKTPISQLRYETGDTSVDIVISPKAAPIEEKAISFREGKIVSQAAIFMGISSPASSDAAQFGNFLVETPLINIDNNQENALFGQVNLVDADKASRAEIVWELLRNFSSDSLHHDPRLCTLLLAGLWEKTAGFTSESANADTFGAAADLVRSGADRHTASRLSLRPFTLPLAQLAGRALTRSRRDPESGIFWSFLTAEDFEKTGREPKDISSLFSWILKEVSLSFPSVLLWQHPEEKKINAILAAPRAILEGIAAKTEAAFQSPHLVITAPFETFRDAEERISVLIKN